MSPEAKAKELVDKYMSIKWVAGKAVRGNDYIPVRYRCSFL
jgi:hypothetical protein